MDIRNRMTLEEIELQEWTMKNQDKCDTHLVYLDDGHIMTKRGTGMMYPYIEYGGIFGEGRITLRNLTDLPKDKENALIAEVDKLYKVYINLKDAEQEIQGELKLENADDLYRYMDEDEKRYQQYENRELDVW
jgi:hypothetical protein